MSEDISLSSVLIEDSDELFKWINSPDLVYYNSNYKPIHEINHDKWFESLLNRKDLVIFSIRSEKNELIGTCQLSSLNFVTRSAELQIRIGNGNNRGKGYGFQATKKLLHFGFNDQNLNRIYLSVYEDNLPAISLYTKCGFKKEGVLIEADFVNGQFKNVIIMAILKREFFNEK
jgi:RimJ/RimL family protein N-acetyltransferase